MLRYFLLAGAAAVAIPCAGLAQVQWSQPLTGENQASSVMDQPGVLNSPTDYDIPFNQAPTGVNAGDYAPPAAQDQVRTADAYIPDASDDTTTAQGPQAGDGVYGSQPAGGYYYSDQGDQQLASAQTDQSAYGQPYQAYGGGGYYTNQPGVPPSYVGQGAGSSQSQQMGQGLGGEGAYQQGNPAPGYTGGGYYTGDQGTYPSQPVSPGYTGGGYYTGEQGAYPSQPYAAQPQGAYAGQSGYYTGQPNAGQVQNYPSQAYGAPSDVTANSQDVVVVVPASGVTTRQYARKTTISNLYEIRAARIALRRSNSPQVRDYANRMIQQHRQGLATIVQASAQAGVPQRLRLDYAHRAMLRRLRRAPASQFDAVYMNQQTVAHMNMAALQSGYARYGQNPVLQQLASASSPAVQQHLAFAWNMTGQPQRLAARRSSELAQLDQTTGRGQVYRGYTVIGPSSESELSYEGAPNDRGYSSYRGYTSGEGYAGGPVDQGPYYDQFNVQSSSNDLGATGYGSTPMAYQQSQPGTMSPGSPGYTSGATGGGYQGYSAYQGYNPNAPGSTAGTTGYGTGAGVPGTSGYGTTTPGMSGTTGYGNPQYQGYSTQGLGSTTPGQTNPTPGMTGSPQYQGYTSPGYPGYQGYATPGSPAYSSPGMGTTTPGVTAPTPQSPQTPQTGIPRG